MNQQKQSSDLDLGRGWLRTAERRFGEDEDPAAAHAAAAIGNGFIALAHAERAAASMAEVSQVRQAILTMSDEPETTLVEAVERERRAEAEAEARPHDDELVPCDECDQPDGIADDSHDLPDPARAAERVNAFLAWFGDGQIGEGVLGAGPPLFARDLQALTNAAVDRG